MITEAVKGHDYSRMELADFLGLHYSMMGRPNQRGWRDINSKELTCVMRTEVRFLFSFTFLVVKSAGPE
jgi:hypothetical protein